MGADSKIEWCDATFNAWVGCTKVSPACDHCYAEGWAKRSGLVEWGNHPRRRTSAAYWRQPLKWNREAEAAGVRKRVFCASLADVFDNQVPDEWRSDLWLLIAQTPHLDWLLLTKRPQNIAKMLPTAYGFAMLAGNPWPWPNVWLGTTAEDQDRYDQRWPHLAKIPAVVRFVSYEPALGPLIDLWDGSVRPDWLIAGGESGGHARPAHPDWFRDIRDYCAKIGTAFFFKQHGEWLATADDDDQISYGQHEMHGWNVDQKGEAWAYRVGKKAAGRLLDGIEHNGFPAWHPLTILYGREPI